MPGGSLSRRAFVMPRLKLSEIIFYKMEHLFFGYQERGVPIDLFDMTKEHIQMAEFKLNNSNCCTLHLYGRYDLMKLVKHFTRKGYEVELIDEDVLTIKQA